MPWNQKVYCPFDPNLQASVDLIDDLTDPENLISYVDEYGLFVRPAAALACKHNEAGDDVGPFTKVIEITFRVIEKAPEGWTEVKPNGSD